jgi:(p)ppGpp synthase/HD superfamily hydrolase
MPHRTFTPTFLAGPSLVYDALTFARALHRDRRRESDAAPFILHPLEVAALLHVTGHSEAVVAAAILHDTVEDTEANVHTIAWRFGSEIRNLVAAMTENPNIESYPERKAALRRQIAAFGDEATAIYAADKVCKVRELRAQAGCNPALLRREDELVRRRLEHYIESLAMLEEDTPNHPLVQLLRFELEALEALPPRVPSS